MQHDEFVHAYKTGAIKVDVDHSKALHVANGWEKLPQRFRTAHVFWTSAWLVTIPAAAAAAVMHSWWAGALILVVLLPTLFTGAKRSAAKHVLDYAVENDVFYSYVIEYDVLRIRPKS